VPDFDYIARDMAGQQMTGTIAASNEQDALSSLAARSLFPVQVDLAKESVAQAQQLGRRVSAGQLTSFYNQLADLQKSGVPLLRSLQLIERSTSKPALKFVIQDIAEQVSDGTRLYESMRRHPKVFSALSISMVRAGEEGGFLEDVLKRIAAFNDHQEELKARVVGAMVYPVFLLVVGAIIVIVMLVKFVPEFAGMFDRLADKGELPWATTTLMALSEIAQNYWLIVVAFLVAAGFALNQYLQTDKGKYNLDKVRLKAPGMGPIVRNLAVSRFCRILGTLLNNGVPILQSLRIAKDATGNEVLSEAISEAAENVSGGRSLTQPLKASGQFPDNVVEMISVAEEANNLEEVLIHIADNTERQTNRQLELFVRLLEPVLLLLMAAIITFIVAALLLPVMRMSTVV
jgi:general secretion pathway protein F